MKLLKKNEKKNKTIHTGKLHKLAVEPVSLSSALSLIAGNVSVTTFVSRYENKYALPSTVKKKWTEAKESSKKKRCR